MTEPPHPAPEGNRSLASVIGTAAALIDRQLTPGDVAALRRLRPDEPGSAAFWRMLTAISSDDSSLSAGARDRQEAQWATVLQAMAEMKGLHAPRTGVGRALVAAGVSEPRFLRLLRSSDSALADTVRVIAHQLATTATPSNHADIAWLVFSDDRADRETIRRRIARDFYNALAKEMYA